MPHILLIFSQSDCLVQVIDTNSHTECQTVQIQISSSEANWSGSTLFAKKKYIWVQQKMGYSLEALLGVLENRRIKPFISGEEGNIKLKGTGEQRQFWGTGNIENKYFDLGNKGKMLIFFKGNKGMGTHPLGEPHLWKPENCLFGDGICLLRRQFEWNAKVYFLEKINTSIFQNVLCRNFYPVCYGIIC